MGNLSNFYDPNVEPSKGFDIIPSGWYVAWINDTEIRDAYQNNGEDLSMTYEIKEGPYAGRIFWHQLRMSGTEAKRIGRGQKDLSAIVHAIGLAAQGVQNHEELRFKTHLVRVEAIAAGTKTKSGHTYSKDKNQAREWKLQDAAGVVPGAAPAAGMGAAQNTAPAANGAPPWARPEAA